MMMRPYGSATFAALAVRRVCGAAAPLEAGSNRLKYGLAAAALAALCTMTVPAWGGYSLPGWNLEVVQSGQALPNAGISYLMTPEWNQSRGLNDPVSTSFTLPSCNEIDFARLYLDIWGGSPPNTATVAVSVNGTQLPTISIGGTNDANPTYNAATTCVYGSGFGFWQLAIAGVGNLLNTNGSANAVTWTVNDPTGSFDGRTYCASLITAYTSSTLNQTLDYDLAGADGLMADAGTGAPTGRTLTIAGADPVNAASATYYAGYTLGVTDQYDSLSFNGTALGANPNDVAQGSNANYGPSVVSSNVATCLSGTNTVQYSVAMPGGQTYLRANIGLLAVTHPLSVWAKAVSGSWSPANNWTGGAPNTVGASTEINVPTNSQLTITLDEPVTLGALILGNSGSTTVGYTLTANGGSTLTFSNSGYGARITVANGSHAIDAPVVLADNLVVSGSGTLDFGTASSIMDGGGHHALTMSGSDGTLILSGTDTYSGGTTVTAGTLVAASDTALPKGTSLTVGAGGTLIVDPSWPAAAPMSLSAASAVEAVPEPGSLALLTAGLVAGFAAWRTRKPIREFDPQG
jgi:autotransporter-associated beta strand protein